MKKTLRTMTAVGMILGAGLVGGADVASAAPHSDDPATQAYYEQVQRDYADTLYEYYYSRH